MASRSLSILVHGPAKAGKSTVAATCPPYRLFLDVEGGTKFLNVEGRKWNPQLEAPPEPDGTWDTAIVTVTSYDDAIAAYNWLQSGKHPFRSVVVDSISELQQRLVEKISGRAATAQNQWGDVLRQFMGLMRDLRDLTEHPTKPLEAVVLVAMTKMGGDGIYHPWLQGQAATILPYLVDVCGAMYVQSYDDGAGGLARVHRLLIGQNMVYETGERAGGRLPGYIDNPDVAKMLDMVFGEVAPTAAVAASTE